MFFVNTAATNKYFDIIANKIIFKFFNCVDDAGESGGNVGEVGDATTDDEGFVWGEILEPFFEDEGAVLVGFIFGGVAAVFAVIEEFFGESSVDDSVGEEDACASTGDESEDISIWIENFEFEA